MAELTVQEIDRSGLTLSTTSAAAGGDVFDNGGDTFMYLDNGDASSMTVTITAQGGPDGLSISDLTFSVGATSIGLIGPFPPAWFNDSNGQVNATYSSVTSLNVAAVKLPER